MASLYLVKSYKKKKKNTINSVNKNKYDARICLRMCPWLQISLTASVYTLLFLQLYERCRRATSSAVSRDLKEHMHKLSHPLKAGCVRWLHIIGGTRFPIGEDARSGVSVSYPFIWSVILSNAACSNQTNSCDSLTVSLFFPFL